MQTITWFIQEVPGPLNFLLPPVSTLCLEPLTLPGLLLSALIIPMPQA